MVDGQALKALAVLDGSSVWLAEVPALAAVAYNDLTILWLDKHGERTLHPFMPKHKPKIMTAKNTNIHACFSHMSSMEPHKSGFGQLY
jgi:hypothetical protein